MLGRNASRRAAASQAANAGRIVSPEYVDHTGVTATTLAPLFVVHVYPPEEWDERLSWLHAFYDGGGVAGLLLAGALSQTHVRGGLLTAAGLTAPMKAYACCHFLSLPNPQTCHHICWRVFRGRWTGPAQGLMRTAVSGSQTSCPDRAHSQP
jgi:hypothetical protein